MRATGAGFDTIRSMLMVDPLDPAQAEAGAPADALVLDLAGSTAQRAATAAEAAAALLARIRTRAYRPRLLVRLSGLDGADADGVIDAVMAGRPDAILLAACPDGAALQHLGVKLAVREAAHGIAEGTTAILAAAGASAAGMLGLGRLRGATPRLAGLCWDASALAAECGATSAAFAEEDGPSTVLRTLFTLGAAAAGVPAFDTPSRAQGEAFARECATARRLGFTGKIARDGGQVATIGMVFAPAQGRRAQPM